MSDAPAGVAELVAALEALEIIGRLTSEGRAAFDASEDRRLALAFCWISVGSALKQFSRLRAVPSGSKPFAGPIRMRDKLAYQAVGALSPDVLWETCARDGDQLAGLLADLRRALEHAPAGGSG